MLKKRIIKGLILIAIGFIICLINSNYCNGYVPVEGDSLSQEYLSTFVNDRFNDGQPYGSQLLQYVHYVHYEGDNTDYSFFCNDLGYPPILINSLSGEYSLGSPDVSLVSSRQGEDKINPQVAYAMSIGILPKNLGGTEKSWEDLQLVIWDAKRDTEQGSVNGDGLLNAKSKKPKDISSKIPKEVYRFRKVYEEIFEKTVVIDQPLFRIEDKQASLFVDQNDGTYIYGPFQLKVNCKAPDETIQYLIMEIMEEGRVDYIDYENGEAYIENFYKFHKSIDDCFIENGFSDKDKKKLKYSINPANKDENLYTTIIVDAHGDPIDFPKVNNSDAETNNFFIKFYPANGGAIINLGKADNSAELFNLKVKYGHYLEYTEHTQQGALYSKGLIATLRVEDRNNRVIDPGNFGQSLRDNGDENPEDTGWRVTWSRIDAFDANRMWWNSFLQYIGMPRTLALYLKVSSGNGTADSNGAMRTELINNTSFDLSMSSTIYNTINQDTGETYILYRLNDYYTNLHCVGFSSGYTSDCGSSIFTPFTFGGVLPDESVDITNLTKSIKDNYGFPLQQGMKAIDFCGIVREEQEVTFSASGSKYVKDEDAYWDPEEGAEGAVYHGEKGHTEYDSASKTMKIYRYRFVNWGDYGESAISGWKSSNIIDSGAAPVSITSGTQDDYTVPSASQLNSYDSSYNYGTVTYTVNPNAWSIVKVYGGGSNACGAGKSGQGFGYVLKNEGWFYDKYFESYMGRQTLSNALGQGDAHAYTYTPGKAVGEYDVWIPKDLPKIPNITGPESAQDWYSTQTEMTNLKSNIQSFISFGIRASVKDKKVYQYGTQESTESVALPHLKIAEAFGGNVWKESAAVKEMPEKSVDGIYNSGDKNGDGREEAYQAVKVDLYECDINYKEPQQDQYISQDDVEPGRYLTSTFTDADGDYRFYGKIAENTPLINPLKKYFVKFVYNGQIYAQTLYNATVDAEYSEYKQNTSKAIDENRDQFNKRFENIYADSNNYTFNGKRYTGCNGELEPVYTYTGRAYGLKHVVQEATEGIANDPSADSALDTFEEQYNLFIKNNTHADFLTTTAEYEFQHAGGPELTNPITVGTGEIVNSDIDKYWEHTPGQPIDYNYSGLSPSVANYLKDCMIEASVPYGDYTHDLTVYGRNISMTDLHKKFPEQATFNLKDLNRTYMEGYRKWTLTYASVTLTTEPQPDEADKRYVVPPEIAKYIGRTIYPIGTSVVLFTFKGEEYYRVVGPNGVALTDAIKVASLSDDYDFNFTENDNTDVDFTDETIKVGSQEIEWEPDPEPPGPGPGPDNPPPPIPQTWKLKYLYWEYAQIDEVKTIEHRYEPPREHYINLYNKEFDLRHCWSFGVYQRSFNEVQLEKDLYKATMIVNGKKEVYSYSGKLPNEDGGQYNFEVGELINLNKPVNGGTPYTREVRKSDYLYDENVAYGDGKYSKNIKAYLTYKIKVHNASPYTIRINEIADYYDADNLEFDGIKDESGRYQITTHTQNIDGQITTSKYTYASNLKDTAGHDVSKEYIGVYDTSAYANGGKSQEDFYIANTDPDNNNKDYHLNTLYIRGLDENGHDTRGIPVVTKKNGVETVTNELLPSQSTILFVTFKVRNNKVDSGISKFAEHIKLDQITKDFAEQLPTIGKNNFAEINSYASYYTAEMPSDAEVTEKQYYRPYSTGKIRYGNGTATYLNLNDEEIGTEENSDICIAGVVDVYSDPGSFTEKDVEVVYTSDGKYKDLQFKDSHRKITRPDGMPKLNQGDAAEESLPTVEPDMDKAPSIRIILDDDEIRKISGYVFEDNRTINSDGSPIGNGKMDDGETKINGVTVQLVELIQDVDYDGTFTGQYIGEKVWDECEYTGKTDVKYQLKAGSENQGAQYYSGKEKDGKFVTKYILNSLPELTQIYTNPNSDEVKEDGKYCFAGLPSGDFIVRFIYGDTDRTVLTNGTDNNDAENAENNGGVRETAAVNDLTGRHGMNVKSYNGQDFKSTVYQRDLASNSQVNQEAISYKMKGNNEVKGYIDTENQDYASLYNYNNNALRTKEQLYDSDIIYYAGQPINNSGDLQASNNGAGANPRSNIANSYGSMWRYDRVATANNKELSDVNDLYGYRKRGIDYAQGYTTGVNEKDGRKTLLNYRAEVLSSFERRTSQEYKDGNYNKDVQNAMIDELTNNTYMVAQTGIISMNNEYEGINDNDPNINNGNEDASTLLHMVNGGDTHINHESNVDLGLVERPRAQVKLTKNVSNIEIKLADGQTLFNANTSMKNLMYAEHKEHEITYNGKALEKARVTLDTQKSPELIKAEIDDEIMNGATINMTYHLQVENVGEVDYADKNFYFFGKKNETTTPVTTKVVRVIDYVPNDVSYDASKQNEDAHWDVYKPNELVNSRITENSYANNDVADIVDDQSFADTEAITNNGNIIRILPRTAKGDFYDKVNRDYVTRTYAKEVQTYNSIVVTRDMDDDLLPTIYGAGKNIDNTTLILTTSITSSGNSEDLTYNNLAEVIETANAYGRRMQFSISGNQEMANQDINDGGGDRTKQDHHAYSSSKIVQPREIDADSAQEVQILPPTGSPEYRNKLLTIITTTIATIIVLVGAIIIKKKVYDK